MIASHLSKKKNCTQLTNCNPPTYLFAVSRREINKGLVSCYEHGVTMDMSQFVHYISSNFTFTNFISNFNPDNKFVIVFTVGDEIRQYRSRRKDYLNDVTTGVRLAAIDVDTDRRLMYWTDSNTGKIYR